MIEGSKTRLRPMTPEEIPLFHRWVNDPGVRPYWYGRYMTMEALLEDWKPYYFDGTKPEKGRCFIVEADGFPIGMIAYHMRDRVARRVEIDVLIGGERYRDRGYGTDAIRAFLGYLFNELHAHRVELGTYIHNLRAICAYEKAGFVREGVLREADWVEGRFVDCVVMSILEDEFQAQECLI